MSRGERVTPRQAARDVADNWADNPELWAATVETPKGRPIGMVDFPRGPDAGDALHHIFQTIPFERGRLEERQKVAAGVLDRFGIGHEHLAACVEMLEDVLEAELPGAFCLADVALSKRGAELEFHLPAGNGGRELSRGELAQAFEGASEIPASYRTRLKSLEFASWQGFLRGFIDLTVEHDGKLYVVDYKSNFLGPALEDYSAERIESVMSDHHYFLQAVLYACAAHAHASKRVPAYEYEKHFGGVMYLFVRGMTKVESGSGVCFFRPSLGLLERVLGAIRGGGA
jgi:exodeoxyribonuclease V beta subunit